MLTCSGFTRRFGARIRTGGGLGRGVEAIRWNEGPMVGRFGPSVWAVFRTDSGGQNGPNDYQDLPRGVYK